MRLISIVLVLFIAGSLAACGNPHKKAAKAQAKSYEAQGEVAKQRLRLVDQYQECVISANNDTMKIEACDSYLKAAEALK